MNILIIYAHPNHQSFNGAILRQVKNHLNSKHQVRILDLYAEKFDPLLHFDEDHLRRDLDKDPEMEKYRQLISWADHLIWIFPIWWGGMPAILKGFIDRVFASGFAYSYKGMGMQGHLKGKLPGSLARIITPGFVTIPTRLRESIEKSSSGYVRYQTMSTDITGLSKRNKLRKTTKNVGN